MHDIDSMSCDELSVVLNAIMANDHLDAEDMPKLRLALMTFERKAIEECLSWGAELFNIPRDTTRERRISNSFVQMAELCGSGIERELFKRIVILFAGSYLFELGRSESRSAGEVGHILVQQPMGKPYPYKADILIVCHFNDCYEPLNLVVECDGPFHDKYNQYHQDRIRDRWMQAQGYNVFRFPTEEIRRRGSFECAREVFDFFVAHTNAEMEDGWPRRLERLGNLIRS